MRSSMKRAGTALLAAVGITAGTLAGTVPAQAATPGDLFLIGGTNCYWKGWGPTWDNLPGWRMHRWMGVTNIGGSTMTNVTVTEFTGPTKTVVLPNQPRGELRPGQTYIDVDATWQGCWPSSISGYTVASQVENLVNNWGFWANVSTQPGSHLPVFPTKG